MRPIHRPERAVLVLRDASDVTDALRQALDEATPDERLGLERALALAVEAAAATDAELRTRWVRRQFAAADYSGPADTLTAIKVLRDAVPGLSLRQAVALAKEAAAAF